MDAHEKQQRRLKAAALFEQEDLRDSEIAALLEVSPRAVSKWHHAYTDSGTPALLSKGPSGPVGCLDADQRAELRRVLRRGEGLRVRHRRLDSGTHPLSHRRDLRCALCRPSGVWRLLHAMGWSRQAPVRRAVERDDDVIAEWVEQAWPEIEKRGTGAGRGPSSRAKRDRH